MQRQVRLVYNNKNIKVGIYIICLSPVKGPSSKFAVNTGRNTVNTTNTCIFVTKYYAIPKSIPECHPVIDDPRLRLPFLLP